MSVYSISKVSLKERSILLNTLLNRFQTLKENKKDEWNVQTAMSSFPISETYFLRLLTISSCSHQLVEHSSHLIVGWHCSISLGEKCLVQITSISNFYKISLFLGKMASTRCFDTGTRLYISHKGENMPWNWTRSNKPTWIDGMLRCCSV